MKTITQIELQSIINYNENTGLFIWSVDRSKGTKAGALAGTLVKGYILISIKKKKYSAHRLAWLYMYGEFPKDQLDHINHDRADNRIDNLREVSNHDNRKNMGLDSRNTSGTTGVFWRKDRNRWSARIGVDGEFLSLGSFVKYSDAVDARKNAEALYGFHLNHGKDI